jgi:hypothetical protein
MCGSLQHIAAGQAPPGSSPASSVSASKAHQSRQIMAAPGSATDRYGRSWDSAALLKPPQGRN